MKETKHADEMKAAGFTIDTTCYPWVAYKGARFNPEVWHPCYTDLESRLLGTQSKLSQILRNASKPKNIAQTK